MNDDTRTPLDPALARYARQMRYAPLGEEAQLKLRAARALVCGVGALGSVIADTLVRAGVGKVRLVDRDFVELTNLQRQMLFDERDAAAGTPKAIAAAEKLRAINRDVEIEPIVADVDPSNILQLFDGVDVIVDGTDNFETRFLMNDAALKLGIPWVYGGAIGGEGRTMTILPGETPCLRCVMAEPPPPGTSPTCDTAGVVGPVIHVVGALQAMEALKILAGRREAVNRGLTVIDVWHNTSRTVGLTALAEAADCGACKRREFPWLEATQGTRSAVLCGRNSVQITGAERRPVDLEALAAKLATVGRMVRNPFLVRATIGEYVVTVFPDGRAIIGGTDDIATARSVYARYIGA